MLDVFRKDVIGETPEAEVAKCFHTYAATDRLSKTLVALSSIMVPMSTFVQCILTPPLWTRMQNLQKRQIWNPWKPRK